MKLKALDKALPRFDDVDPDHFVEECETKDADALLYNITNPVTLSEWKQIKLENGYKKISFVTQDVSAADSKNKYSHEYSVFVKHKDLVRNQYAVVQEIKGNLNVQPCTVQMDFAENCVMKSSLFTSTKTPPHCIQLWCNKTETFRMKTMRKI